MMPTCDTFAAPIDVQDHCFVIETKKAGGKCMMQVKHREGRSGTGGGETEGWTAAGAVCFRFSLYENAEGICVVNVEAIDPE
jgi:hypothetical protein